MTPKKYYIHKSKYVYIPQLQTLGKDFRISGTDKKPTLVVDMKYYQGVPVIDLLTRVSRPGLRVYRGNTELPKVCNGLGVAIISTPKGVVTDHKARSLGVGGEVLCYVA